MMCKIGNQFWRVFCIFIALAVCIQGFSPVQPVHAATCTVTSDADSGGGTLRELLADTTCDTINFGSDISIHLASPLWIGGNRTVTVDGAGYTVNITNDNYHRVMTIASGSDTTLQNITITQGSNFVTTLDSIMESSMIPNLGTLKIINSSITGDLTMPSGVVGSAVMNQGTLIINHSTFTGHSAMGGGAIYNDGYMSSGLANVSVTDSTFTNNTSWLTGTGDVWVGVIGGGGAITNFAGTLTVTGSTFTTNTAEYVGGAIVGYYGTNTITNTTFVENSAVTSGGAVMLFGGALTNNTFYGNSAPNGGALFILNDSPTSLAMSNNLLINSGTSAGMNCHIETTAGSDPGIIASTHNLADDDSCGEGFTNSPSLSSTTGTLDNYGGPTQTIPLLSGSAAIDAADNVQCPDADQRGVTRPQGSACDIGAYEFEEEVVPNGYIISGVVYEDLNANGTRDTGEIGAEGAQVILDLGFNYQVTYAAADGGYQFNLPYINLPEGYSVTVFVEAVQGIKITQMPAPNTTLTGNLTGMDIGLHRVVLTPTPANFPDGVQGDYYNQTISVIGGDAPYSFEPSPTQPLPAGLSYAFDEQLGTITLSGTPTETGEFLAHIDFTDANSAFAQVHEYFTIYPPMVFSPASLPDGSLGTAYDQTITVSGGLPPYTFVIGSEQWLPAGLTMDTNTSRIEISGTPSEAGRVTLDVYVSDQTGTTVEVQRAFWIKTAPSLTLTSSTNPSLEGQQVTFSLGSTATVAHWPAPWGTVSFKADGTVIPGCDSLWLEYDPNTDLPAPNPVTCTTSSLGVGTHEITAELTALFSPYTNSTATLPGGQTVNAEVPAYQSSGFSSPVDVAGVLNTAKAGQMIPLKWRLLDASGNPVTNLDPASVMLTVSAYACQAGVPTDAIETYTSGTTLLQNLGDGYYQLNWKTEKSYAYTCKQVTLKLGAWSGDGFTALFKFVK